MQYRTSDTYGYIPGPLNKSTCRDLKYQFTIETRGSITGRPLLFKKQIFIYDHSGTVFSLGSSNNQIFWQRQLKDSFITSGVVDNEGLTLGGKHLYRIRRRDGEIIWETTLSSDSTVRVSSQICRVASKLFLITKSDIGEHLCIFDKESGCLFKSVSLSDIWENQAFHPGMKLSIGIDANCDIVAVSTVYGILCFRAWDLKLMWKIKIPLSSSPTIYYPDIDCSCIAVGDVSGNIYNISPESGSAEECKKVLDEAVIFHITPAVGALYCCGHSQLAAFSAKSREILWKKESQSVITSGIDLYTNICAVGDITGNLIYYDLLSGEISGATHKKDAPVSSRSLSSGNYMYFALGDQNEFDKKSIPTGLTCFSVF